MIYQSCQNKNVDIPAFVGYNEIKGGVLMIYSIYEIQQRIAPVAKQYGVKAVFLFGSYARGEAREDSDIFSLWEHCIATLKRRCKSRSI